MLLFSMTGQTACLAVMFSLTHKPPHSSHFVFALYVFSLCVHAPLYNFLFIKNYSKAGFILKHIEKQNYYRHFVAKYSAKFFYIYNFDYG